MIKSQISRIDSWQYQSEIDVFGKGFDLLLDQVMIIDRDAIVRYANPAMFKKTGYSIDEAVGQNPHAVWGGNMTKEFYGELWYTVKQEKKHFIGEVLNKRKDGSEYLAELHISPVLDERGEPKYFIGVAFDVTARRISTGYKTPNIVIEDDNGAR